MAAGWIPKGPDTPAPAGAAPSPTDPWTPVGPDQATIPSLARPHQAPDANAIENTRNLFQASRDVLFGHTPDPNGDRVSNYGIFPSIIDSLKERATEPDGPSWETLAQSYPHVVGAQLQKVGAGYQESHGAAEVQSAGATLAALNVLPQVAARMPGTDNGAKIDAMAKDALVQKTARSVGLDPVVFANLWGQYSGLTPEEQADEAAKAQSTLSAGKANLTAGKSSRLQAWADETAWAPSDLEGGKLDPWSLKGVAFNAATMAPTLAATAAATVGATALAGPAAGMAAGGATAAALFAPAQREDVKNTIDGQVDTLLQKADEADRVAPIGQQRGLNPVSTALRQQAADLAASSDKIADTAGFFYGVADAAGALPVAAVLSKAPGGQAVLNRIVGAGLSKTVGGRIASSMVANGAGGMLQASIQKAIDVGIVHENQSLSDALKDIAYTGVTSAITAAPIAAVHEAAGAPARAAAQRTLDSDALAARVRTANDAMAGATGPGGTQSPEDLGYTWNNATKRYDPPPGAGTGQASTAPRIGPPGGSGATTAPSGATEAPSGATEAPSGETNGSKAETYQAKVETLNQAAAQAEKRSDLSLQPEEEGWSIHVNGEPVATFDTAANAREALAQARKLVGTAPQGADQPANPRNDTATPPSGKTPETPLEQTQPIDRRQDTGLRTRVDQMTPEQMKAALLTHEMTGIPNRRAYEDSPKKAAQASVDVDSLKWVNDNLGHEAGDQMLKAVAQSLHEASGGNAYHISGDEFVVQGDTTAQASSALEDAKARLSGATLTFEHPDGRTVTLKGIGVSHGVGSTLEEAESALRGAKSAREQSGLRAPRGEQPPGASIESRGSRVQAEVGRPAASEEAGQPGELRAPPGQGSAPGRRHAVVLGQDIEHPDVPTDAQAQAGNYFKPTVNWHGLPIKLENLAGSKRPFVYPNGKPGSRTMRNHYGYFPGHEGADQDGVDAFIGGEGKNAHIVDQLNPSTGKFDEHKVIVGAPDTETAKKLYLSNYQKDWQGLGAITQASREELGHWLEHGDTTKPYAWQPPRTSLEEHLQNSSTRTELERMAKNAGWAEVGGKMIRQEVQGGRGNEFKISRTPWIPKEPWFQELAERLPAKSRGYEAALEAAKSGGKISALERRVLTEMAERASESATDWRHSLSPEQLGAMSADEQRARLEALNREEARLEAEAERSAIQAGDHGEAVEAGDDDIPFAKGQGDLFGSQRQIANEILKAKEAIDKKLGKGKDVSLETGRPDDLFSQARQQVDITDLVKEGEATYGQVSEPSRASRKARGNVQPAAGVPAQLDIFAQRGSATSAAAVAQLSNRAKLSKVGEFRSAHARIDSWTKAAQVLAPIRKSPQEVMAALVLDKLARPLAVIRHSVGVVDGATVEPWSITGAIAQVPGASSVYLAHNHPSGAAEHSQADNRLSARIADLMRGSGIDIKGMVVVTPGGKAASFTRPEVEGTEREAPPEAGGKTKSMVPVMGRALMAGKGAHPILNRKVESPAVARHMVTEIANGGIESGILLLDTRHTVRGIVPMSNEAMARLRTGNASTSQAQLLKLATEANTKNLIAFGSAEATMNVEKFARAASIHPLDSFYKDSDGDWVSNAERGISAGGEAFLKRGATQAYSKNLSPTEVKAVANRVLAGFRVKPTAVVVVPNVQALRDYPDFKGRTGFLPDEAHALLDPQTGKIFFVADQMHSPEYVAQLMAHEYVTHFGLRALLGDRRSAEYRQILEGVAQAAPAMLREQWELEFPGKAYKPFSADQRLRAAEEVLATHAEAFLGDPSSAPSRIRQWLTRLQGFLRDWIRKVWGLPQKFDELFIRRTLSDLAAFLRNTRDATFPGAAERPMRAETKETFFSGLARAVDAAKREKGTGAEWEATLKNMPGVKPEEMQWTGLKDWLAGRGRVSKAEVADYIAAHRVQVGEVTKGSSRELTELHVLAKSLGYAVEPGPHGGLTAYAVAPDAQDRDEADGMPQALATALEIFNGQDRDVEPTKYSSWATPGGENYREMLLTLDSKHPGIEARKPIFEKYAPRLKELYDRSMDITNSDQPGWEANRRTAAAEHARLSDERDAEADRAFVVPEKYRTRHWDEPNILAHIRFDDRTGPNGERVLHLHEIQSDWHQAGRREGYETPESRAELAAAKQAFDAYSRELGAKYNLNPNQNLAMHAGLSKMDPAEVEKYETLQRAWLSLRGAPQGWGNTDAPLGKRVPDAPFKTTWPELAVKRMLRYAAEHGYDALSWDTGDTNAERYNMQQMADRIVVKHAARGSDPYVVASKGGRTVVERPVPREQLSNFLGKEMAQKVEEEIAAGKPLSEFTGDQLKIGGQGMRGFYDDMLPKKVQALVKKWGSSVEPGHVPGETEDVHYEGPEHSLAELKDIQRLALRDRAWSGDSKQELADVIRAMERGSDFRSAVDTQASEPLVKKLGGEMRGERKQIPAHSVAITPAMRDSVLAGQPLFKRKPKGPPPAPKPPGPIRKGYDLVARGVAAIPGNEFSLSLRRIADPANISSASKATALVTREALGELAQASEQALHNLQRFAKPFDLLPHSDRMEFIYAMEEGKPQPIQAHQPAADAMRELMDDWRDKIRDLGVGALDNFIENYFPHIWKDVEGAKKWFGQVFGRRPLKGPASFLKERTIPTTREGIEKGFVPVSTNPLVLVFAKVREMQRFYSGVKLMQRFKDEGLARYFPATRPLPEGITKIDDAVGRVRQWSEAEQGFIERGFYAMPTDAARVINNHLSGSALRNFLPAQLFRSLTNVVTPLQLSFSAFHLGFTTLDAVVSKNALGIERLLHGEPIRAAKAFLEANSVLGGVGMNLRRGQALMKAYSNISGATPEMRRIVEGLMAAGGRVKMDNYFAAGQGKSPFRQIGFLNLAHEVKAALTQPEGKLVEAAKVMGGFPREYSTRLMGDLREIWETHPGMAKLAVPLEIAGRAVRASTAIIMEHIVPLQKLGVFSDLAADHIRRNPGEDPVAFAYAMQRIWDSVDNRLGEMVYDNVFWNRTFKDVLHMGIRAVGWNVGTVRELGGAPIDALKVLDYMARGAPPEDVMPDLKGGNARLEYENAKHTFDRIADKIGHKIPYAIALFGTAMVAGAALQYLLTGQGPTEIKDYFFPRTGRITKLGTPERVSLPSYIKDVYEYSQHPIGTVINKANPIFGIIHAIYANEDFFGDPIRDPEAGFWRQMLEGAQYAAREVLPFAVQGVKQFSDVDNPLLKYAPYVGVTPAPAWITSPEQMERYQQKQDEDAYLRKLKRELHRAVNGGDQVHAAEIREEMLRRRQAAKETEREIRQDKSHALDEQKKALSHVGRISSLIQGKSKPEAVAALQKAGLPAFAQLWSLLPERPKERVAHALEAYA